MNPHTTARKGKQTGNFVLKKTNCGSFVSALAEVSQNEEVVGHPRTVTERWLYTTGGTKTATRAVTFYSDFKIRLKREKWNIGSDDLLKIHVHSVEAILKCPSDSLQDASVNKTIVVLANAKWNNLLVRHSSPQMKGTTSILQRGLELDAVGYDFRRLCHIGRNGFRFYFKQSSCPHRRRNCIFLHFKSIFVRFMCVTLSAANTRGDLHSILRLNASCVEQVVCSNLFELVTVWAVERSLNVRMTCEYCIKTQIKLIL